VCNHFFAREMTHGPAQWADIGGYLQTVALLARDRGLHTCPQQAWVSFNRQTAASSEVSVPTIRSEKVAVAGMPFRMDCSTAGASLQPQPPPWASAVRRVSYSAMFNFLPQWHRVA